MARTKAADAAEATDTAVSAESVAEDRPVGIGRYNRRTDSDVLQFAWCKIETGPYAGQIGSFQSVVAEDDDHYPEVVLVELRNSNTLVTVDYADISPAEFGGR